jgi:ferrous iron transport protein A
MSSTKELSKTLAQMAPGERGRVQKVNGNGPIYQRLLDFGILRGTLIEVECEAPLRDPIKIKVRGSALTLRKNEARMIEMTVEPA